MSDDSEVSEDSPIESDSEEDARQVSWAVVFLVVFGFFMEVLGRYFDNLFLIILGIAFWASAYFAWENPGEIF